MLLASVAGKKDISFQLQYRIDEQLIYDQSIHVIVPFLLSWTHLLLTILKRYIRIVLRHFTNDLNFYMPGVARGMSSNRFGEFFFFLLSVISLFSESSQIDS